MPTVFDYGEWLGDIQVVRLLRVSSTAAIYEARRGDEKALLKVAHDGCQDPLRSEAVLLSQLMPLPKHVALPTLEPAYAQQNLKERPYGKITYQGVDRYYLVFKHVEGEFLRDALRKNPQPWYQHAAWMVISLASAVTYLHQKTGRLHLNLSPDVVFVRTDQDGIPRPVLLDLGMEPDQVRQHGFGAYTAPELAHAQAAQSTDVYGLGLILYEMLAGQPVFPAGQTQRAEAAAAVMDPARPPLNRTDLAPEARAIVERAISYRAEDRQPDPGALRRDLEAKFGKVPAERTRRLLSRRVVMGSALVMLVIVALTLIGLLLG